MKDSEPLLELFLTERLWTVFLYKQLRAIKLPLLEKVIGVNFLQENSSNSK